MSLPNWTADFTHWPILWDGRTFRNFGELYTHNEYIAEALPTYESWNDCFGEAVIDYVSDCTKDYNDCLDLLKVGEYYEFEEPQISVREPAKIFLFDHIRENRNEIEQLIKDKGEYK